MKGAVALLRRPAAAAIRNWPLTGALCLGAFLRAFQLLEQIPAGDEWHNLDAIWRLDTSTILSSFDPRHSMPMVLYGKLLLHSLGLSEIGIYMPTIAAGMLMIAVFPLLSWNLVGKRASMIFAGLLAISPMLVLYSRFFRPYILTALGSGLCLWIARRWMEERKLLPHGAAYALVAVLTISLHLITAPFVLTPFPLALLRLRSLSAPERKEAFRKLVLLGAAVAAGVFLTVGIPILNNASIIGEKISGQGVRLDTLGRAAFLLSGSNNPWVAALLGILALRGLQLLHREHPAGVRLGLTAFLLQFVSIAVLAPTSISSPLVFSRYMLPCLSPALLCLAVGLASILQLGSLSSSFRMTLASGCILLLLGSGPIPKALSRPNAWTSLTLQVEMLRKDPRSRIRQCAEEFQQEKDEVSAFYRRLSTLDPGSLTVVEIPWFFQLSLNRYPWLQAMHHQHCRIGLDSCLKSGRPPKGSFPCDPGGIHFRNLVFVGAGDLKADFIILHRDLFREFHGERIRRAGLLRKLRKQAEFSGLLERKLEKLYGPPCFSDAVLLVFPVSEASRQLADSWSFSPASM